jgi:ABC-type Fe3+-siderophore transport system permease subunit
MKQLATKKSVLIVSLAVLIFDFVVTNPLMFGFCTGVSSWGDGTKYCYSSVLNGVPEWVELLFGTLSIFFLIFSLLTYRMHDDIFRAWWSFARWMVPIIILATIAIQFMPNNHGFFNMDALIYLLVLAPLYVILILVSLWKIFRTHLRLKKGGK